MFSYPSPYSAIDAAPLGSPLGYSLSGYAPSDYYSSPLTPLASYDAFGGYGAYEPFTYPDTFGPAYEPMLSPLTPYSGFPQYAYGGFPEYSQYEGQYGAPLSSASAPVLPPAGNGLMLGYNIVPNVNMLNIPRVNIVPHLMGPASFPGNGTVLVVLDNKKPDRNLPRIGLAHNNGRLDIIYDGTSPVLQALDLESLSLVDPLRNIYAAADSLGNFYIFTVSVTNGKLTANHIARSNLPIPNNEVAKANLPNSTNIEAMRVHRGIDGSLLITWAGRGGGNYPGARLVNGRRAVWIRTAQLHPTSFQVLPNTIRQGLVMNVSGGFEWREITDIDFVGNTCVFSTAIDREEKTPLQPGQTRESLRQSGNNLFDSMIVSVDLTNYTSRIIADIKGIKVEAVMLDPSDPLRVWIGTDDEGLGAVIGEVTTNQYIDVASANSGRYRIPFTAFGVSGMAPGPTLNQYYTPNMPSAGFPVVSPTNPAADPRANRRGSKVPVSQYPGYRVGPSGMVRENLPF
jgi:hypothetical protein